MAKDKETVQEELETIDIEDLTPLETPITPPAGLTPEEKDEPFFNEPKKRTRIPFLPIIIVVILVGIGAAIYLFLHSSFYTQVVTPAVNKTVPTATKTPGINAQTLVEKAKLIAQGTIKTTENNNNVFNAPNYEPTGYEFFTRPSKDYGFGSYGTKATITTDLATIQGTLVDNKLTPTILNQGDMTTPYAAQYDSDDVTCLVTEQETLPIVAGGDSYNVILGCANKSDYVSSAAAILPFYLIFKTANFGTDKASNIVLSNLTITNSKTPDYSMATISIRSAQFGAIGGYEGLFYATPDKVIHYFTGTQNTLSCSEYNTDDLKKAYLGTVCANDSTESVVSL